MSKEEDDSFTITWCIKNFSMCPVEVGEFLKSPVFRVSWLKDSEWSLMLYPKGNRSQSYVGFYLNCESLGNFNDCVTMEVSMSSTPAEAKSFKHTFEKKAKRPYGYNRFIKIENLLKVKEIYLPNDMLTVVTSFRCPKLDEFNKEQEFINNSRVQTVIEVHKKSISWPIRKFRSLPSDKRITLPVCTAVKEIPSFYVIFCKEPDGKEKIEIRIKKDSKTEKVFVKCSVSVTDTTKVTCRTEGEFLFKNDEIWNFPFFKNFDELKESDYLDNTNDILHLQLDFAFSIKGKMHITENTLWQPKHPLPKSRFPFNSILQPSSDQSIVNLKSADQTFKVHRCLLQAESEVFKAMFENDMKEKDTGIVDIASVGATTLGRMVAFMYSHDTQADLSVSDVMKLYSAAHSYQVLSLVTQCSFVLESSLTVSNVCEILRFADLHGDERLLEAAGSFVAANSHRVLVSEDWKDLMESNATMTSKVMFKMLIC